MAMTTTAKVTTLSELIHRVVSSSCLNHQLSHCHSSSSTSSEQQTSEEDQQGHRQEEEENNNEKKDDLRATAEMEELMEQVFSAVAAMKKAYVSLQAAHSPWDPDRMSVADETVVAELRRLSRLKDRFRRGRGSCLGGAAARNTPSPAPPPPPAPLREAVIPYEAALWDARKELKAKEAEVENLKDKLKSSAAATPTTGGKKGGRRRKALFPSPSSSTIGMGPNPTSELFLRWVDQVKSCSKTFTSQFLTSMKSSGVDIKSVVASCSFDLHETTATSVVGSHHTKHAIEAYVNHRIFQGFENETFYMEGTLSSLLDPATHRRECFSQFKSMLAMDPSELLGFLPTCKFGNWAAKRYSAIVGYHLSGTEGLYGVYLKMAKAVWLLHLLAFAMDPAPSHFEARGGAEFEGEYMESVVRFPGERVPDGWVVGFGVGPGFRVGDGSVVRARVYPLPPSH